MLLLLIALAVFGSVASTVVGLAARAKPSTIESRIQDFRTRASVYDDDDVNLEIPFIERVLKPSFEGIAKTFARILPASVLSDVQKQLTMAGDPMKLNGFVVFWLGSILSLSTMAAVLFVSLPSNLMLQKLGVGIAFLALGWMVPRMWLKGKVKAKQKAVLKALPDSLDLITTCVEAGLGLDAALARVAEKSTGPLADELSKMLRDIAMGKLRREALMETAERIGVEELSNFVNSIIQAEQLGVAIAQVLRVQSDQLRTKRRQRAEQTAHEAPIKMLFPLVLFIFPAFLLVILGPAVIRISETFISR